MLPTQIIANLCSNKLLKVKKTFSSFFYFQSILAQQKSQAFLINFYPMRIRLTHAAIKIAYPS